MPKLPDNKFKKGFTLLELLVTIFIASVVLIGSITAISQILSLSSFATDKLTAAYLAQEGIEIVRNVRDTNWVQGAAWDNGLTDCASGCIADYSHSYGPSFQDPSLPSYNEQFLKVDGSGFYGYAAGGTQTKFKRKITIDPVSDAGGNYQLNVTVLITWSGRGGSRDFTVQENLYNWK